MTSPATAPAPAPMAGPAPSAGADARCAVPGGTVGATVPRLQILAAASIPTDAVADVTAMRALRATLRTLDRDEARALPPDRLTTLLRLRPQLLARSLRENWWGGPRPPSPPPNTQQIMQLHLSDGAASAAIRQSLPAVQDRLHAIDMLLCWIGADQADAGDTLALADALLGQAAHQLSRLVAPALHVGVPDVAALRAGTDGGCYMVVSGAANAGVAGAITVDEVERGLVPGGLLRRWAGSVFEHVRARAAAHRRQTWAAFEENHALNTLAAAEIEATWQGDDPWWL